MNNNHHHKKIPGNYKSSHEAKFGELTDPGDEPTMTTLLNGHGIKLHPQYLSTTLSTLQNFCSGNQLIQRLTRSKCREQLWSSVSRLCPGSDGRRDSENQTTGKTALKQCLLDVMKLLPHKPLTVVSCTTPHELTFLHGLGKDV